MGLTGAQGVWAGDLPGYSASPSAVPTEPVGAVCTGLMINSGNNTVAPAKVEFEVLSANPQEIAVYRFHYGDGVVEDFTHPQVDHTYTKGGTFTAFVEVQDKAGSWYVNEACEVQVTLKSPPLTDQSFGCSEVVITGDKKAPPIDVNIEVKGYGNVTGYRVAYHDGTNEDATGSGVFTHHYTVTGTYTVLGYVRDAAGGYVGGDMMCKQWVRIYSQNLTSQPQTGVGAGVWVAIGVTAVSGIGLWWVSRRRVRT